MMKRAWYVLAALFLYVVLLAPSSNSRASAGEDMQKSWADFFALQLEPKEVGYMCLGVYSNVVVRVGGKTILFDPASMIPKEIEVMESHKVDFVVYTHDHGDHFDKATAVSLFRQSSPHVVAEKKVVIQLRDAIPRDKLHLAQSEQPIILGDMRIYPLKGKHIGPIILFKIEVNGISLVHAGDSSYVPLKTMGSHVAFVPTGYPSPTCSPKKAFKMVADIKPRFAIPFHGLEREHKKFVTLVNKKLPDTSVVVSQPYDPQKLTVQ
jgi:L-ascorbate metabolism protein UlaG (beta-lactamase superfamily)